MASNGVFLDTNGWLALLNDDDSLHADAFRVWSRFVRERRPIMLTDWIVAEAGNGLARTPQRRRFPAAVRELLSSPRVRLIFVDSALLDRALQLYADRPDKTWGLVDCASLVAMRDEKLTDAFTTDRHFEQAGFNCLLPARVG